MTTSLFFLLYFFASLVFGGIVIVGWWEITRGKWEVEPNGKKYWSGMIFSGLLKFLTQEKTHERVWYSGGQLEKLMLQVENIVGLKGKYTIDNEFIYLDEANRALFLKRIRNVELTLDIVSETERELGVFGTYRVAFYKLFPVFRFPKWIRKPLATCIYCFASVYGSIAWWFLAVVLKSRLYFPYEWEIFFIFWVPYIIGLSFVLPYLNKKS